MTMKTLKKCKGCGKTLSNDPKSLSYTPNPEFGYCERCWKLLHYDENTHIDQSLNETNKYLNELKIDQKDQIVLINDDAKNAINNFETDSFDLITCNPPYFKCTDKSIKNDNKIKSIARHEIMITLEDIIIMSKKLLKNNCSLTMVHRTERLIDIITLMRKHNIEPKRIQFIYPKKNSESNLMLIDGRKNGKPGLKILKPLVVHEDNGKYTSEITKMFGDE